MKKEELYEELKKKIYVGSKSKAKCLETFFGTAEFLSPDQEKELVCLRDCGTKEEATFAVQRLVTSIDRYIGMLTDKCKSFYEKDQPLLSRDDCFQDAYVGALKAAKTFDPEKGRFSTYATNFIKGSIITENMRNRRGFRAHMNDVWLRKAVNDIREDYKKRNLDVTLEEVTEELNERSNRREGYTTDDVSKVFSPFPEVFSMEHHKWSMMELNGWTTNREEEIEDMISEKDAYRFSTEPDFTIGISTEEICDRISSVLKKDEFDVFRYYMLGEFPRQDFERITHNPSLTHRMYDVARRVKAKLKSDPVLRGYASYLYEVQADAPAFNLKQDGRRKMNSKKTVPEFSLTLNID